MAAYVGLDPAKEIHWVVNSSGSAMQLFADGKIDAFMDFPPEPQELPARNIGHMIVNTTRDRPWSQYCAARDCQGRRALHHRTGTRRSLPWHVHVSSMDGQNSSSGAYSRGVSAWRCA
jgi:hypothetical protein